LINVTTGKMRVVKPRVLHHSGFGILFFFKDKGEATLHFVCFAALCLKRLDSSVNVNLQNSAVCKWQFPLISTKCPALQSVFCFAPRCLYGNLIFNVKPPKRRFCIFHRK
jgi:hypothetical protein